MTELFGGFGGDFYAAYTETWPLDPGPVGTSTTSTTFSTIWTCSARATCLGQAQGLIQRLLAQIHWTTTE